MEKKVSKPLISFCVFSYNQEEFIRECVESVLNIKYENLEIIISDDYSQDNTYQIILETVKSHNINHKIILNRNVHNEGIGAHCTKIFSDFTTGDFIVTLGGDDVVKEDYLIDTIRCFNEDEDLMMIDVNGEVIDETGKLKYEIKLDFESKEITISDYINIRPLNSFAAGRIFRRCLVDDFDRISNDCPTEDTVLILRALIKGKLLRLNKNVVKYRIHSRNTSSMAGLRKISHEKIVAQFYRDALTSLNNKYIDPKVYCQLLKRFKVDLFLRNSIKRNKILSMILNRLVLFMYRVELFFYK